MKELRQSETRIIKRSQINLNPINPKRHTDEKVKLQKKNLQKVGFLGGIVWNEVTRNLIDGHRRVKAMDLHYKYEGTSETDYDVKVEVVSLDEKTEKEQVTYMAVGNTKADYDLIAEYIHDIDYSGIGLNDMELKDILSMAETELNLSVETIDDFLSPITSSESTDGKSTEEKIQHMKDVKQQVRDNAIDRQQNEDACIMLSFSSYEAKTALCELMGIDPESKFAKGEDILNMIE